MLEAEPIIPAAPLKENSAAWTGGYRDFLDGHTYPSSVYYTYMPFDQWDSWKRGWMRAFHDLKFHDRLATCGGGLEYDELLQIWDKLCDQRALMAREFPRALAFRKKGLPMRPYEPPK